MASRRSDPPSFDLGGACAQAALADFLASETAAVAVEIVGPERLQGGALQENWGFEARFRGGRLDGRHPLVLRTGAPTRVPSSLGQVEQFALHRAAFGSGARVPEPLFLGTDPSIVGQDFYVMRRIAGTALGGRITRDSALDPALPAIARQLGEELARLHSIRPPRPDLAFLTPPERTGPVQQIADLRSCLDGHPAPRPVLEWALRWLERHVPTPVAATLCHHDFRTGNYMLDGARLTGILDWEFAGWGDPLEDIAWFCCKVWRFARLDREAGGIADRADLYRGYECAAGGAIDPVRIRFWEILSNVRYAVLALQQAERFTIGGERNLHAALTGRRAGECELELLLLLDPDGAPR